MPDTIFALSSGAPPAAIAIVRVSGPEAFAAARAMAGSLPPPRKAGLRALRDPESRAILDRALVLVFPAAASATGEDMVEFHLHGGRAVVAAIVIIAQIIIKVLPIEHPIAVPSTARTQAVMPAPAAPTPTIPKH